MNEWVRHPLFWCLYLFKVKWKNRRKKEEKLSLVMSWCYCQWCLYHCALIVHLHVKYICLVIQTMYDLDYERSPCSKIKLKKKKIPTDLLHLNLWILLRTKTWNWHWILSLCMDRSASLTQRPELNSLVLAGDQTREDTAAAGSDHLKSQQLFEWMSDHVLQSECCINTKDQCHDYWCGGTGWVGRSPPSCGSSSGALPSI